jgi:hypothetical protein
VAKTSALAYYAVIEITTVKMFCRIIHWKIIFLEKVPNHLISSKKKEIF